MKFRLLPLIALGLASVFATATHAETRIAGAAQPQLVAAADGRVWLAYGQDHDVFVACSADSGKTFQPANKVTSDPKLMLGMRRGPRLAAHGDELTLTMVGTDLIAFRSGDAGRTWSGPERSTTPRRPAAKACTIWP